MMLAASGRPKIYCWRATIHRAGRIHRRDEKKKKEKIDFEIHGKIYEYCYTAVLPW
jgi:hypothetical protein